MMRESASFEGSTLREPKPFSRQFVRRNIQAMSKLQIWKQERVPTMISIGLKGWHGAC
jgi:hypothetical protein